MDATEWHGGGRYDRRNPGSVSENVAAWMRPNGTAAGGTTAATLAAVCLFRRCCVLVWRVAMALRWLLDGFPLAFPRLRHLSDCIRRTTDRHRNQTSHSQPPDLVAPSSRHGDEINPWFSAGCVLLMCAAAGVPVGCARAFGGLRSLTIRRWCAYLKQSRQASGTLFTDQKPVFPRVYHLTIRRWCAYLKQSRQASFRLLPG